MDNQQFIEFDHVRRTLEGVSVGTISFAMIKLGYKHFHIESVKQVGAACRFVGRARTLSTFPFREDISSDPETESKSRQAHRGIVEGADRHDVLVIAARGVLHAAVIGDLLIERAKGRGAAAVVTDGAVRDTRNFPPDFPVIAGGVHTMTFRNVHSAGQINVPVACGEVLVLPGDLIVGDEDGVIVVPWKIARQVADASREQEDLDGFLKGQISAGASLDDVAPPSEEVMRKYREMTAG